MLNFSIHRRGRSQRRANIDLHKPRFEILIYQNIKSIQLKPTGPLLLSLRMNVKHDRFSTDASLYYDVFYVVKELYYNKSTLVTLIPIL